MSLATEIAIRIIKEQELIIGPIAWDEARKVEGLRILDHGEGEVFVDQDGKKVLGDLVAQYERLFGRASREVCKEAIRNLKMTVPIEEMPESLR